MLARIGTGAARIDVRIVAPDGTAAYRRALAADIRARRAAGGPRGPEAKNPRSPRNLRPDGYVLTIEFGAPAPLGMLH